MIDDLFFDGNDITSKRRRKFNEGIENILNKRNKENEDELLLEQNKNDLFLNEICNNAYSEIQKVETILTESDKITANSVNDLFKSFLIETVIDSLNIKKDLIDINRNDISNKIAGVYDALEEEFDFNNPVVSDVVTKCSKAINEKMNAFSILDYLAEDMEKVSSIIKGKVSKVLREEKEISNIELLKEEGNYSKPVDTTVTLFKEMLMTTVKSSLKEIETLNESYTNEEIMTASYLETVVDYTILEALNTLELINFNEESYLNCANRKVKNVDLDIFDDMF